MKFEFTYQDIYLTQLALVHALKAPPHHRCYSWGATEDPQEQASQAFFMRFMFDRCAPAWMGAITLRATQRCSIPPSADSAPVDLYIDDGQHRLVNLVLTARATHELAREALTSQARHLLSDEDVMRLEKLAATSHLAMIAGMDVECRLSHEQSATPVHSVIDSLNAASLDAKARLVAANEALEPTRLQCGVDSGAYKAMLADRSAAQMTLSDGNSNLIYNAYLQLRRQLQGSSYSDFVNIAEGVVERLQNIHFALILCQPVS